MWWKALWSVHLWALALSHNPTARAAAITLRGAALSYRTLPKRNDCNVFEKKPIEGLVFLNWRYLSVLIKLNKYYKPPLNLCSVGFSLTCVWAVKDMYNEKYLTFMAGVTDKTSCGCSWPVSAAAGCIRWWYAGRSEPFPWARCSRGCPGCYARPATCPAGSPPPRRSAIQQQQELSTKGRNEKARPVSTPCSVQDNIKPFSTLNTA